MNERSPQPIADEELLRRAQEDPAGDVGRAAASDLLERYQGRVYLWCYRYARDHERALDLAQDVLINAYRSLQRFQGRSRFSSWLFAIARNRCLDVVTAPSPVFDDEAELDAVPDPQGAPDKAYAELEDEQLLIDLMKRNLDTLEQEALWLRCFERMPVDEITRVLELVGSSGAAAAGR